MGSYFKCILFYADFFEFHLWNPVYGKHTMVVFVCPHLEHYGCLVGYSWSISQLDVSNGFFALVLVKMNELVIEMV